MSAERALERASPVVERPAKHGEDPFLGRIVAGRYRVVRLLGAGGMGRVYEARHVLLELTVAIKVLPAGAVDEPEARERFQREAEIQAKLRSEHIVSITDFGYSEDGSPYLVMEYLHGRRLDRALEAEGPFTMARAVNIARQIGNAVRKAHANKVVHRDLKPGNVFLLGDEDGRERVKVLDFGVAKRLDTDGTLTRTNAAVGTVQYMSPEQARGEKVDELSDIHALGIILFEMLTSRVPYPGSNTNAILYAIQSKPPLQLRELLPNAPRRLVSLVTQMLSKARHERPRTIGEVGDALAALAEERSDLAIASMQTGPRNETPAPAARTAAGGARFVQQTPSVRLRVAGAALLVVAAGGIAWRAASSNEVPPRSVAAGLTPTGVSLSPSSSVPGPSSSPVAPRIERSPNAHTSAPQPSASAATRPARGLQENESPSGGWDTALYVWNGTTGRWSRRTPASAPPAREFAAIYHDPVAHRIVVVGGVWYGWQWTPEYWQYDADGDVFSLVSTGAAYNRFWSPITYDERRNVAIQFGGAEADPVYYGGNVVWNRDDTRRFLSGGAVSSISPE